jgi:hypothetical protein
MLSKPQDLVLLEGLGKLKIFNHLIGTRTLDLPACSIAFQPSMLPRAPKTQLNKQLIPELSFIRNL